MRRSLLTAASFCLLVSLLQAQTADDDLYKKKIDDTRKVYFEAMSEYEKKVKTWFAAEYMTAQGKGLKYVDAVEKEIKSYEIVGVLPKRAPSDLSYKLGEAARQATSVYKAAIDVQTKTNVARARELERERKLLVGDMTILEKDSVWRGEFVDTNDPPEKCQLRVTERKGNTFKAEIKVGKDWLLSISGTLSNDRLKCKADNIQGQGGRGPFKQEYNGAIRAGKLVMDAYWPGPGGGTRHTIFSLKPPEPK